MSNAPLSQISGYATATSLLCIAVHHMIWPVIINKPSYSRTEIKLLHHNGNLLEQKRRCSNIACPTRSRTKVHPVNWAVGLHRNRDTF